MGTVDAKPNNNWRFVPEEWVKPAAERDFELLFKRNKLTRGVKELRS